MKIVIPHAQKLVNTSPTLAHRSGKCKPEIWAYSHGLHCVWELPDLSWNSQLFPVSANTELPTSQWNHNAPSAQICLCGGKSHIITSRFFELERLNGTSNTTAISIWRQSVLAMEPLRKIIADNSLNIPQKNLMLLHDI